MSGLGILFVCVCAVHSVPPFIHKHETFFVEVASEFQACGGGSAGLTDSWERLCGALWLTLVSKIAGNSAARRESLSGGGAGHSLFLSLVFLTHYFL